MRLFAYKLAVDSGFAPNPFHGWCTLATCKPQIRLRKREGDWIAGFTSKQLNADPVGHERLIYLMRVDEKIGLEDYFRDPRFAAKKPRMDSAACIDLVGDNIYDRVGGRWVQLPNRSHGGRDIKKDTDGRCVLISRTFSYFGSRPLEIPPEVRPQVPRGQSPHGVRTADANRAQALVDYVMARRPRRIPKPSRWREGDTSWRGGGCG
jgi:hypothetical protein